MADRLFIAVLGNRNSGKTTTWNTLFGTTVRTGRHPRTLPLLSGESCEVFLISGSPEERGLYAADVLENQNCRIILCSIQYTDSVHHTLEFVVEEGCKIFVQWLNPGFNDSGMYFDKLGLTPWLLARGATLSIRDGTSPPQPRVDEIRNFIYGWAKNRSLTF